MQIDKTHTQKVIKSNIVINDKGCWEWQKAKTTGGYGVYVILKKNYYIHRLSALAFLDFDIDSDLHIIHKCDNRICCNPEHLLVGTNLDNVRDKVDKNRQGRYNSFKTHCKRGHEFTETNTYINSRNERQCRMCNAMRQRIYHKQNRG